MSKPRLSIVIHAEEEFPWDDGFYRSNNQVSHGEQLIELVDELIRAGGKVTLAMDYPFVTSQSGQKVIRYFKPMEGKQIEFAAHLHPWVNPPYESQMDRIENIDSFPGNLPSELEYAKLKVLTETIEKVTGTRPTTYLAGRYGIGKNSAEILKSLGYRVDLSISAYTDFSNIEGPDFSLYSNAMIWDKQLIYIPHTCSVVSPINLIANYLNRHPVKYKKLRCNAFSRTMLRLLRVKMYRLSPEGFTFEHLKAMTESQINIGKKEFILSFHSPSAKVGCTPYVQSQEELSRFKCALFTYLNYFKSLEGSQFYIPKELGKEN
ncbi:hypothetical protein [Vibrio alfacsensis]|uniref:hypothetical protein n=1 Tax=Vibrio alfacsensis TaxID=1074311 RepID=UPI004067EE50